jgi:biopolymer transport protein ExbB/TolQ
MFQKEDVDSQTVALIAIFGSVLTFTMIVGAQVLYYRVTKEADFKSRVAVGSSELHDVQTEQRGQINSYRWVNKEKEIAAIPIERAMELELHALQSTKK